MMTNHPTAKWIALYDEAIAQMGKGNLEPMQQLTTDSWYDWFCKDSSLLNKTITLGKKVKIIAATGAVDLNRTYVWFKNNCPMDGTLYDDIRFSDITTGNNQLVVVPRSGHNSKHGMGEVWGAHNDFNDEMYTGFWGDIKKWLKTEAPRPYWNAPATMLEAEVAARVEFLTGSNA